MKIARYGLKVVYRKELILTMEDDVDSEELLKIFLETQLKEKKEPSELLGIIAEKVSEESCTEQCESCQKYCPASEECMARILYRSGLYDGMTLLCLTISMIMPIL